MTPTFAVLSDYRSRVYQHLLFSQLEANFQVTQCVFNIKVQWDLEIETTSAMLFQTIGGDF